MTSKSYHFLMKTPSTVMLEALLHKNAWQKKAPGVINDELLLIPDELSETLEFKHRLADFLKNFHLQDLAPETHTINDENYLEVLQKIQDGMWILKPSMLNNGQHIHLFHDKEAIFSHFQRTSRMGGNHVLQSYIHPPHLLKGPQYGHKYSLRLFVVMTFPYAVFLYPHGYFNICLSPYSLHSNEGHLTNEHLSHEKINAIQIPTFQYEIFQPIFPKIKNMLVRFFKAFNNVVPFGLEKKLVFLGVDFMLDSQENLYLLEMNHGPCFPTSSNHPLQSTLYSDFWDACYTDIFPKILNFPERDLQYFYRLT